MRDRYWQDFYTQTTKNVYKKKKDKKGEKRKSLKIRPVFFIKSKIKENPQLSFWLLYLAFMLSLFLFLGFKTRILSF